MASPASVPSYLNSLPKRTPKLTYRTKSDNASLNTTTTIASSQPASPIHSDACLSPRYSRSETYSQFEGRLPSLIVPAMSPHQTKKNRKKKPGLLAGLFGVKEPSAQALLDYQKQLLGSNDQERKGRPPAVGLGVSSAKLPPTVPKVNSKWNGVPETAKEKEKRKQLTTRQSMSHLTSSVKTEHSGGSADSLRTAARPPSQGTLGGSSVHSSGSGNHLADLYGWELTDRSSSTSSRDLPSSTSSQDLAQEHKRPSRGHSRKRHSGNTLQAASNFAAGVPDMPKIPQAFLRESPTQPTGFLNPPDHSHSPGLTPYNSSPVTPNSLSPMKSLPCLKIVNETVDGIKTTTIDAPIYDEVIIRSSGYGILPPPASAKRLPKSTSLQASTGVSKTSRTQSGTSSTQGPSAAETEKPLRSSLSSKSSSNNLRRSPSATEAERPLRSSLSSKSSSNNLRRAPSARERLSLGMTLKHQAVAPWGWSEMHPETQAITNDPATTFPTPADGSVRKRLSIFKK